MVQATQTPSYPIVIPERDVTPNTLPPDQVLVVNPPSISPPTVAPSAVPIQNAQTTTTTQPSTMAPTTTRPTTSAPVTLAPSTATPTTGTPTAGAPSTASNDPVSPYWDLPQAAANDTQTTEAETTEQAAINNAEFPEVESTGQGVVENQTLAPAPVPVTTMTTHHNDHTPIDTCGHFGKWPPKFWQLIN